MTNFNSRAFSSIAIAVGVFVTPLFASAQVPALYGATDVFSWYRLQALGNTVSLGSDQIKQINAGSYATYPDAVSGDLKAVTRAKVPIGNASLVVDVVAKIPASSVAKAVANFAVKVAFPLQVGVAVYDLLKELNYTKLPDGTLAQEAPGSCSVAPCAPMYGFSSVYVGSYLTGNSKTITIPFAYSTQMGACNALAVAAYGIWPIKEGYPYAIDLGAYCRVRYHDSLGGSDYQAELATPLPSPPKYNAVTRQQLEDAIAAKSGWPATSAIARAVKDAVNSGESVDAVPQTVTGPASTPGTTTSSTTSGSPAVAPTAATSTTAATAGSPAVDSITTTSTTTNNYTYQGNTVTVTNSTVTTTTNNTTGQAQTATTTKAPEVKNADLKPDKVEDPASDTPLGAVPTLYTPVYPRGVQGVWDDQKTAMSNNSVSRLVPSLMPSVGTSGQCPTMPINLNLSHWANFGTVDVAPPCWIWDFGKVVIVLSALLLARSLVFGG